jgi:type IX secretion system PorP/SprF family membrane protein
MHLNKAIFTFIFIAIIGNLQAQQVARFSQNMFTYDLYNPGYFAMRDVICVTGISRMQWVDFKDASRNNIGPQTYLLTFSTPLEFLKGGIGGNFIKDKIGSFKDIGVNLGYAYKTDFMQGKLGIGVQLGILNHKIDYSQFDPLTGGDPVLDNQDETCDLITDISLGLFYNVKNQYYIGISAVNLLQSKGNTYNTNMTRAPATERTIYLVGGYEFVFKRNPLLKFKPSVLVKSNFVFTQISFSGLLEYNNHIWGGVTYNAQTSDALAILVGLKLKDFKIGYAYDLPLSSINTQGSHEIMLSYCFKLSIKKKKDSYRNTRFL